MAKRIVIILVVFYNLIGLVALLGLSRTDPFYWEWNVLLLLFTFPITMISFLYRFAQSEPLYPIFIIQAIMLCVSLGVTLIITKHWK